MREPTPGRSPSVATIAVKKKYFFSTTTNHLAELIFTGKRFTRHSTKINHEKGHKGSNSHGATVQESPDSADFDDKKRLSAILNSQGGGPNPDQKQRSLIQEHVTGGYEEKPRVLPDMSPYEDRHVYEERFVL